MKGVFCPLSDVFVPLFCTCSEDQIFIRVLVINYNPEVGIDYYILYYCYYYDYIKSFILYFVPVLFFLFFRLKS